MTRNALLLFAVVTALVAVAFALREPAPQPAGTATSAEESHAASGYRASIDPATGELTAPPEQPVEHAVTDPSLNRSGTGLVEEPSPVVGGGVMVDLRGRFHNTYTASVESDGQVVVECTGDDTGESGDR